MCCHVEDVLRKVLTVSRKSERLVNLTIALLATKRFITKSEIFKTVDGYEGSNDAKERMFERDKDDLRALGIEIEVGSFDPLFSDEAGYRIKQERYQLDLGEISTLEVSLLSLAAGAWKGASLGDAAQRAIVKLRSLGLAVDESSLTGSSPIISNPDKDIATVTRAIVDRAILKFEYRSRDYEVENREVIPVGVVTRSGHWYLTGVDQDVHEFRTFRFDRIVGSFAVRKGPRDFEIPDNFDVDEIFDSSSQARATLQIRRGKGTSLRALALSQRTLGEWDEIEVPIFDLETLSALVLWHGEDVYVQGPFELRKMVIASLDILAGAHV